MGKRFNDRVIKDGFPDGWFIQDRLDNNEALLCRYSDFSFGGSTCICVRPRAMETDAWVPTARAIATLFEQDVDRTITPAQAAKVLLDDYDEGGGLIGNLCRYSLLDEGLEPDTYGAWVEIKDVEVSLRAIAEGEING